MNFNLGEGGRGGYDLFQFEVKGIKNSSRLCLCPTMFSGIAPGQNNCAAI